MGGWFSKDKNIDSNGEVNNNVIVEAKVDGTSIEVLMMLGIITAKKVMEFLYVIYRGFKNNLKKKYSERSNNC